MELNAQRLRRDVIVIGASAGGLEPTYDILAALPKDVPVITGVVVHRGAFGGRSVLADLISRRAGRPVVEPFKRTAVAPGVVYLGPRDLHLLFVGGDAVGIRSAKEHFTRPAVDPLFVSAAESYGRRVVGVLLSGGGSDGVVGLIRIKEKGGISLVQQPAEASCPSMPVTALREDHVDAALSLAELARTIPELARGKRVVTSGEARRETSSPGQPGSRQ